MNTLYCDFAADFLAEESALQTLDTLYLVTDQGHQTHNVPGLPSGLRNLRDVQKKNDEFQRMVRAWTMLKPGGTLYLHCEPAQSKSWRTAADLVFQARGVVCEGLGGDKDVLLCYTRLSQSNMGSNNRDPRLASSQEVIRGDVVPVQLTHCESY